MYVNFSIILMILLIAEIANADSIVQTTNGPVRGTTVASGKVEAFLGIPYAEPPVGDLRFAKPVAKSSWEDVYDANQLSPGCIQAKIFEVFTTERPRFSEDCLYLNIWVSQSHDISKRKAIILFIHGGGFMLGSGNQKSYDGASLAEHGDVIVVTINYRLGGLGFFTGFIDDAPGNIGMHDQVAAIRWIKENAEVFQGDPNNIVLMGSSAGAFSVSAHLISPLSRNLFRRAIILSGTVLHPTFSNNTKISKLCHKYAKAIGCTADGETLDNNAKSIVECMKNLPHEKIAEADMKIFNAGTTPGYIFDYMLHPRVGDDFLPESAIESFRKGNFENTEILIGIARDEGSSLLSGSTPALFGIFGEKDITSVFNETSTRKFIRYSINSGDESEDEKIIQTYMARVNREEEYAYLKALRDAYGDYTISCGSIFQADIQSLKNNPIYFYMFDYLPPSAPYSKWMGIPHGADLNYIFGNPFFVEHTEMEKEFMRDIMNRLVTFAKTGNPNIPRGVTWPRYTFEDPKYLVIGKRDTVETKPLHNRCEVWRKQFGSIIDDDLIRSLKHGES